MITLLLALGLLTTAPYLWHSQASAATPKPKPNYIIDGQALSLTDAIKYAVREPNHVIYECKRVELVVGPRSVGLKPVKPTQAPEIK